LLTVIIAPCNAAVSCQMTVYTKSITPSHMNIHASTRDLAGVVQTFLRAC
jgi:acetaldehyde dehydrogenase (acetylating)